MNCKKITSLQWLTNVIFFLSTTQGQSMADLENKTKQNQHELRSHFYINRLTLSTHGKSSKEFIQTKPGAEAEFSLHNIYLKVFTDLDFQHE